MMFLLQPYYDHDRGVLDHVLTRVSRGWPRFRGPPGTPDLRTDHDGRLALVESSQARLLLALDRCGLLALGRCGPLVRTLEHPAEHGLGATKPQAISPPPPNPYPPRSTNALAFAPAPAFHDPTAPPDELSRGGGPGRAGPSTAWMPWPSPQGRVYGVSCTPWPTDSPTDQRRRSALHDQPPKTRRARDLEDLAPGWDRRGREDPPIPFLRGNALAYFRFCDQ